MSDVKTEVKTDEKVTVENIIDGAIIAGFKSANAMFLESLEDSLQKHVLINEAGDAHKVLQQMIDDTVTEKIEEDTMEELASLTQKLSSVLS